MNLEKYKPTDSGNLANLHRIKPFSSESQRLKIRSNEKEITVRLGRGLN